MSEIGKDLISPVITTSRSGDAAKRRGAPDRVQFNKDKHGNHQKQQRQQKRFSKENQHIDLQA